MLYEDINAYRAENFDRVHEKHHHCKPCEETIHQLVLARAYVPIQHMCHLFSPAEGLKAGTAFPELVFEHHKKVW